jgi:indolepyruvate ferredoxin oxidoreductase alpha subunit
MNKLLLCNEAVAQAAIDAGVSGMYAYPGTPSTEIMEYFISSEEAAKKNIHRQWSSNEKTAVEAAIGMSYAGKRAMVAMKHVGLNVAADAFMNVAVTGVNGGLIVVVADDPSMHSSQNEQDSRFYARFANIPCYEPSNQQEAYDMVFDAFRLSEKYRLPVLMRLVTRLAHSRAPIKFKTDKNHQNNIALPDDPMQYILLPANARKRNKILIESYEMVRFDNRLSKYNSFEDGKERGIGVIAAGIAYNYLKENISSSKNNYPILKISTYPFPKDIVLGIFNRCGEVIVLEDGYPFLEESLRGLLDNGKKIYGRMDGTVPRDGELNPNIVARALGISSNNYPPVPSVVKPRPPQFCRGCSHIDMYLALNEAMKQYGNGRVFADIGCYTLGALPPYKSISSTVDMGASITMAIGAADAGLVPSVAVIGDSTFTHSGMTGLLDAVIKKSPITVVISDNSTTAMTGGQKSQATGMLDKICLGLGVEPEHMRVITPLPKHHEENVGILREEIAYNGVSVIISRRECIQTAKRKRR